MLAIHNVHMHTIILYNYTIILYYYSIILYHLNVYIIIVYRCIGFKLHKITDYIKDTHYNYTKVLGVAASISKG